MKASSNKKLVETIITVSNRLVRRADLSIVKNFEFTVSHNPRMRDIIVEKNELAIFQNVIFAVVREHRMARCFYERNERLVAITEIARVQGKRR